MPKTFTTWTVLPHHPIEKPNANLWRLSGKLGETQRQMVMARMNDGRVLVHNPIAMGEPEMKELEAWGEPSVIFVPNGYHRQDSFIWKQRYPKAKVVAPPGAKKRVDAVVAVDAVSPDAPRDENVRLLPCEGLPGESILEVKSDEGITFVFGDAVLNMPKLGFPMGFFLGPTGTVSAPRVVRWIAMKDKKKFAAQLDELANTPNLKTLMFGHGRPITSDAAGALRSAAALLR